MNNLSIKQILYLLLAILGLLLPGYFISQFFAELGAMDWSAFMTAMNVNAAATAMSIDLLIVLLSAFVFMIPEGRNLGMKFWWVYPIICFFVSAAFGIPLFLFMRERHLQRVGNQ